MSGGGGGGSADAAWSQSQADEMRMNPGSTPRWGVGERRRMLIALLPFIVVLILAFWVTR